MRKFNFKDLLLNFSAFVPLLAYAIYLGLRDTSVGSDTQTYVGIFRGFLLNDPRLIETADVGFLGFMQLVTRFSHDPSALFTAICIFIALSFYIGGILLIKNQRYLLLYIMLLVISPYYLAININILRHGLAVSAAIIVMALSVKHRNIIVKLMVFYVPALFHQIAGLIALPMIWGTYKIFPLAFWFLAAVGSAFSNVYAPLASRFIPSDYIGYFTASVDYRIGFRPDFIAFSAIPLLFSLIVPYRKMSPETRWVFNAYLLMNGSGHLMNFVSYSDRFLTSSWTLLPLLVTLMVKDINERAFRKKENKRFFSFVIVVGTLLVNSFFYLRGA